jgi:hypothetical protein
MANSKYQPFTGFSVTATATEAALNPQPYKNTHTLVIFNSHATQAAFLRWQDDAGTNMTSANSVTIPPNSGLTLPFGPTSTMPSGTDTNVALNTLFIAASGAGTVVYMTYINGKSD